MQADYKILILHRVRDATFSSVTRDGMINCAAAHFRACAKCTRRAHCVSIPARVRIRFRDGLAFKFKSIILPPPRRYPQFAQTDKCQRYFHPAERKYNVRISVCKISLGALLLTCIQILKMTRIDKLYFFLFFSTLKKRLVDVDF